MIGLDASILILLSGGRPPADPNSGDPVLLARERVEDYIRRHVGAGSRLLIPAPAMAEFLVGISAEKIAATAAWFDKQSLWNVVPFDARAAIEHAKMTGAAIAEGDKREGRGISWAQMKFDRQIASVARVNAIDTMLCDDGELCAYLQSRGLKTLSSYEIPIPDDARQTKLVYPDDGDQEAQ